MGSKTRAGFDVYPPSETQSGAAAPRGGLGSERDSPDTAARVFKRVWKRGGRRGGESRSALPKRDCRFLGRAAVAFRHVTHRPQGQMCVSGQCTSVSATGVPWLAHRRAPRLCRVGCGRDSKETAAQRSLFFFSRQGEESERSGITRGWSTQSDMWEWGHTVPWGGEQPARGITRSEAV